MKIRRYYGKSVREVMKKVKTEEGPDCIILANREVTDGIEIVVAVEFDEVLLNKGYSGLPEKLMSKGNNTHQADLLKSSTPSLYKINDDLPRKSIAKIKSELNSILNISENTGFLENSATEKFNQTSGNTEEILNIKSQLNSILNFIKTNNSATSRKDENDNSIKLLKEEIDGLKNILKKKVADNINEQPIVDLHKELKSISGILKSAHGSANAAAISSSTIPALQEDLRKLHELMEQQVGSLVWSDITTRNPVQARLLRQLMEMNLSPKLCKQLVSEMNETSNVEHAWRHLLAKLANKLPIYKENIFSKGGVIALHGPTGVGKTTTIAKLAARYAVTHGTKSLAVITMDNHRIGAHSQLRIYTNILNIPIYIATDQDDLQCKLESLSDKKLILIDTAGFCQKDPRLDEQLDIFRSSLIKIHNFLVISCTTSEITQEDMLNKYADLNLHGTVLTKLDEAGSLGSILSLLIKYEIAVAYICDGQRIPEDIFAASAYKLVSRNVALMNQHIRGNAHKPKKTEMTMLAASNA